MTKENDEYRLELLKKRHKNLHATVEALEGEKAPEKNTKKAKVCLLYTSPSPRDRTRSRMPSSA